MKKSGIMSILAFFLFAAPLAAQDYSGPKIEVKEIRYDFGKVIQGTQASHVFEITNRGSETLVIERVQSS